MHAIEYYRKKAGISQKKLAEELKVTQGAISQWERGVTFPSIDKLPELAKILKCNINELINNLSRR